MRRKGNPSTGNAEESKRRKNERDAEEKRVIRSIQSKKQQEQEQNTTRRQKTRDSDEKRIVEQQRNTEKRRKAREDEEIRDAEQHKNTEKRRLAREDEAIRDAEQQRDTGKRRLARGDEAIRDAEQQRDTEKRRLAREDEAIRDTEQQRDTEKRRLAREDEIRRNVEQGFNTIRRREVRNNKVATYDQALATFRARNREGPTNVCVCCGSLYFRKSVTTRTRETLLKAGCTEEFLHKVIVLEPISNGIFLLCSTCWDKIRRTEVPKRSLSNGLAFPKIPECLQGLTHLEEILASPRIAFMMMRALGWDGQYGLKGNIINVPIDVNETEKVLPREISNSKVVHLALMRKMEYKHPYLFETIRPEKVYTACKYLVNTPVYKEEGITLSEKWKNITCPIYFQEAELPIHKPETENPDTMEIDEKVSDDEEENNMDISSSSEQTMLLEEIDFLTTCIKHAPGEGKRPISLLWDLNAEVLTFPSIYCGEKRNVNPRLTYTDVAKSEALNADRRACVPQKLLYSFKKSQQQQVVDSITISLRKRSNIKDVTAGNLLDPDYISGLESRNEGYRILRNIRSSPVYWEARKKELFATIRQLVIPTLFHTVSAMEVHWPELIVILKKILDKEIITEEQAAELPLTEKNNLIRRDPITCARYFDAKTQDYFNFILKTKAVFTDHQLQDYFMRVEFQHRGSPHLHIFLWLKNAPKYEPDDPFDCVAFIDQYITTKRTELSLQFQVHRHTQCCRRLVNGVHICRFGIPYPPLKKTQILVPLSQDYPEGERILLKNELAKIKIQLKSFHKENKDNISYDEFLKQIDVTEEKYLLIIRSNIRRPTVFLKREVESAYINAYNENLLTAWRSNMDLQFVLDPYACAKYLSEYISKSYRGMSTLMRKTVTELERGNMAVKTKLKTIGSLFVNKSEVSAQEAAYGILGLQLSKFSRDHVYINTGAQEDRSRLTKSREELLKMSPEDTNVTIDGLLEHYINRAVELENTCLADYAAWFNFKSNEKITTSKSSISVFHQRDGNGYVKRRQFAKVIRSRHYSQIKDPFMFAREQLMLYYPWRNEEIDINKNTMVNYIKLSEIIKTKALEYNKINTASIEDLCDQYENESDGVNVDEQDKENKGVGPTDQNLFDDKSDPTKRDSFLLPGILPQSDYEDLLSSLNQKQKNYLLHVIHCIKSKKQILEYLGGGAGVGKSTTIRAIVQALTRYLLSQTGSRPDLIRVLLCAPTGIAAFNIEGKTIHSTFILPFNQTSNQQLRSLDPDTRTRIASKLIGVKLIICDELSMVSNYQLGYINKRLQEFFQSKEIFGGHSLIFVGDLWQLPPIGGSPIFSQIKQDISSLAGTSLWDNFRFYELDEIMRQQGDPAFAQALNRMKVGAMIESDILLLKSREITAVNKPPANVVWLFHHRMKVNEYNNSALEKCKEIGLKSQATDKIEGKGELNEQGKTKLLTEAKQLDYQDAKGLPFELILKPSIRYMVTSNIHGDLANGAIGILRHVTTKKQNGVMVPCTVWIEFPEARTGAQARTEYHGYTSRNIEPTWTPIETQTQQIKTWEGKQVRVIRTQFPLTPAEAITIYKSQSQTFQEMVLTLHTGITRSLLYVGCSRARSSSGLWINGTFQAPKPVGPTNKVHLAYEELRQRPVLLSHLPTPAPKEGMVSIIFYNVQHYGPHKSDVDYILSATKPNILALVETHTWPFQTVEVPGYNSLVRSDLSEDKKSGYGTVCLSTLRRNKESVSEVCNYANGHVQLVVIFFESFTMIYGYSSPKTSLNELQNSIKKIFEEHTLSSSSTILIGDFNKDLNTASGVKLGEFMKSLGMPSCLPTICSTTKSGTQIDCVFSGIHGTEAFISSTLSSHHDPIFVFLPGSINMSETENQALQHLKKLQIVTPDIFTPSIHLIPTDHNETINEFQKLHICNEVSRSLSIPNQSPALTGKKSSLISKLTGLQNPSTRNLCFANASLQALRPVFDVIQNPKLTQECLYTQLLNLFQNMGQNERPEIVTTLLSSMSTTEFNNSQQHDAADFLHALLEQLHLDAFIYGDNPEIIASTFRILLSDREKSLTCTYKSQIPRPCWLFVVPLFPNNDAEELGIILQNYNRKSSSSPKTCPACGFHHCMLENISYEELPRVLIIQLGRFLSDGTKLEKLVNIPHLVHLPVKMGTNSFRLSSVINHIGNSKGGHYISKVKHPVTQEWIIYDDTHVTQIQEIEAINNEAYILIYKATAPEH